MAGRRPSGVAVAALCAALSGCALANIGQPQPAPQTYDLLAPLDVKQGRRSEVQLIVSEPTAVRALAGDQILVKPGPSSVTYFPDAVWSDQLPRLLQARLMVALESSGRFRGVGDGRDRIDGDLELTTQIRAFEVDAAGGAVARIVLFVRLIEPKTGRVVASKEFSAEAAAAADTAPEGVEALNRAAASVLPQIVGWSGSMAAKVASSLPPPERNAETGSSVAPVATVADAPG